MSMKLLNKQISALLVRSPMLYNRLQIEQCLRRGFARMLSDPENRGSQQRHINFDTLGTW